MTDYTDIANTNLEPGDPITDDVMQALNDNPKAIAEGSATGDGAPVNQAMWHPYDMVTVGDGNDGLFYDQSVDGTVASVETPDFEDGYEYRVLGDNLDTSNTSGHSLQVALYKAVDAAYSSATSFITQAGSNTHVSFDVVFNSPRIARLGGAITGWAMTGPSGSIVNVAAGFADGTSQKVDKGRFSWSAGNINSGTLHLYRRRLVV